jgi:hypothetical protein
MSYPSILDLVKGQEVKMAQANGETTLQQRLAIVERAQTKERQDALSLPPLFTCKPAPLARSI